MSKTYEVEIKSLLGSKENADKLIAALRSAYPDMEFVNKGSQLNHYFNLPADLVAFSAAVKKMLVPPKQAEFDGVISTGKKISVRTRELKKGVLCNLVVKASVGDDTSANGVRRIEFEAAIGGDIESIDEALLAAGCTYQAKWSREREEYAIGDIRICIDKNAGYGYLAEFEKVVTDEGALEKTHKELESFMARFGIAELPQDRLERMFAHYNAHWAEYYGTEKTFNIE